MKTWAEVVRFFGMESDPLPAGLVAGLSLDSRDIQADWIFIALSGNQIHGGHYWLQAKARGAMGLISDQAIEDCDLPVYVVTDLKQRLADFAGWFYDYPSKKLKLTGITGTNGKTSSSQFLAQMLEHAGRPCGVLGTLGNGRLGALTPTANTTLDSVALNRWLSEFVSQGLEYAVVEVSSHAIALGRIEGLQFACVALTQVSRDHLDFHLNLADYRATKKRLFEAYTAHYKVVNSDDEIGQQVADEQPGLVVSYSQKSNAANLSISDVELNDRGINAKLHYQNKTLSFTTPLIGQFNVENLLCASLCLLCLGIKFEKIESALSRLGPVIGRMERVSITKPGVYALVDYAHTPDALEQVLLSIHAHQPLGKLWLVFGCGGNRDRGKRPLMAQVAQRLADRIILTNDNPRFEAPQVIIDEICEGFSASVKPSLHIELNRQWAIEWALAQAQPGDWVLVVGKGHENYQDIGGVKTPFSDQQVMRAWQQI
ncbi:UDP-N-acetylmuramoyl-L-alanyl-D-glutamate--2,6-diaminopimelate ligase [Thiomicrospira sp. R3]|uniref:UDP-N-acetylmuramoyl-L-alanyl-D-glutamate--2, 6-diaminopimelate ligase n=1 Tax=Thiomicrospira sp. R3 TaxID=3035472 RepID=UPI00259BDE11|nr:UDP-N-acetylmuramoyl-L-alanyl-D-glutamate--2,6-diaminopimelate ligase [Thiomicrospira sp. R3]WFE67865.1 UDP-N-acetylmuramoyl-L-alanyl-D-glutamate--2,6-diaminopimelate ligase [Thiomicrospira sp. R3]